MSTARVRGRLDQVRISQDEARRVLDRIVGLRASQALAAVRFGAATRSAPVADVLWRAVREGRDRWAAGPEDLVLVAAHVGEGETVTRVRRQAHGMADWIRTPTTAITIELGTADPQEEP